MKNNNNNNGTNIVKTNTNKSVIEFKNYLDNNGVNMTNVTVDGKYFTTLGYVSEADKEAALKVIQEAIDSSDNLYEAAMKIMTCASLMDNNLNPTEEVEINGDNLMIDYDQKKLISMTGETIVYLEDMANYNLPNDVIKAMLIDRYNLIETSDDIDDYDYEDSFEF